MATEGAWSDVSDISGKNNEKKNGTAVVHVRKVGSYPNYRNHNGWMDLIYSFMMDRSRPSFDWYAWANGSQD